MLEFRKNSVMSAASGYNSVKHELDILSHFQIILYLQFILFKFELVQGEIFAFHINLSLFLLYSCS